MNYSGLDRRLRDARYAAQLSVEQVAEGAMVTIAQIEAMECGGFDDLPPEPYRAALVCQYSEFLGVDVDAIYGITDDQSLDDPHTNRQLTRFRLVAGMMLVLLALSVSWLLVIGPTGSSEEVVEEDPLQSVSFIVRSSGFFVVHVDGVLVHEGEMKEGSRQKFSGKETIDMSIPSIGAVPRLKYNGEDVRPDGVSGHRRLLKFGVADLEVADGG